MIISAACGHVHIAENHKTEEGNRDFPALLLLPSGLHWAVTQERQLQHPRGLFWGPSKHPTSSNSLGATLGLLMSSSSGAGDGPQWYVPLSLLLWLPGEEWQRCWQHSTDTEQSCVCSFCHTDQHSWHGTKLYPRSETARQAPSRKARQQKAIAQRSVFHCIMQLCQFWLGGQSPVSGSRVSWNCG